MIFFIHLQIFIEYLLSDRHCSWCLEYISEKTDKDFCAHGVYILLVLLAVKEHELFKLFWNNVFSEAKIYR